MFWRPSLLVAEEPIRSPTRALAIASGGIVTEVKAASPIPTQLTPGWSASTSVRRAWATT